MVAGWTLLISILVVSIIVHPEPAIFHWIEYLIIVIVLMKPDNLSETPTPGRAILILVISLCLFSIHAALYIYIDNHKDKNE